ncbi:MAG: ATP-binding protein [Anaeromyxobacter sp.]
MGNALFLLERVDPASEQGQRALGVLARQFQHLSRLVDDLLDATRVTSGKIRLRRSRVDLAQVLQSTVEDHRSVFARAQVELGLSLDPAPLWVDGDAVRLAQVLGNLLGNAVKFNRPGGRVEVSVATGPGAQAVVRISDDGAGISADMLERIFQPFAQGDQTLDRSRGGLGLGLALAKGLVELHGGSIEARSDGPGHGAEFAVRLPLLLDAQPAAGRPARSGAVAGARRILVVEDNADAAQTLRDLLALSGHAVEVARDGRAAMEAVAAFRPDLVLCNLGLPGMTGHELARALRAGPGGASLQLVALTGYGAEEDRRRARASGFDALLVKPVAPDALEELLLSGPRPAADDWQGSPPPA